MTTLTWILICIISFCGGAIFIMLFLLILDIVFDNQFLKKVERNKDKEILENDK